MTEIGVLWLSWRRITRNRKCAEPEKKQDRCREDGKANDLPPLRRPVQDVEVDAKHKCAHEHNLNVPSH